MASGVTNYLWNNFIINFLLRGVTFQSATTKPYTTIYVALFTATPSDSAAGTEVTAGQWTNYARQPITVGTGVFAAGSGGSTSNSNLIDFGTSSGGTGAACTQWGVIDSASGAGNLLFWGDLTTPQTVSSGNPASFAIGALVLAGT